MKSIVLTKLMSTFDTNVCERGAAYEECPAQSAADPKGREVARGPEAHATFDKLLISYVSAEVERKTAWNAVVRRYAALVHGRSREQPSAAELLAVHRATQRVQESEQKITSFMHTRFVPNDLFASGGGRMAD